MASALAEIDVLSYVLTLAFPVLIRTFAVEMIFDARVSKPRATLNRVFSFNGGTLFFCSNGWLYFSEEAAPTLRHNYRIIMNIISIFKVVRERLVDEIAKELLNERFIIVSACYRDVDGKRVRMRKAHLRKRKR